MNLAPGVVLDKRYELLELLGEGGMGQVFKARHNRLGKLFAVKSLRHLSPDPAEQAKFLDAFESEARTLAELNHPALARVSDFFEMNGIHFLVMEFIDGKTLARVVELAPRNLSQRRVLQWAKELCQVLEYLHSQKPPVIVRDLKPENVMIDSRRRLRLIDFGISKRLKPGEGTRDIVKGMGTAEYAPLEQYGSSTTDQRSDIYALGATLYFLLTEIPPPPAWKRASEGAQPVPPSQVNRSISPDFEHLVLSMMALRREDRPNSVAEVVRALEGVPERHLAPVARAPAAPAPTAPPKVYQRPSAPQSQRYGMPGSSLDKPKTKVRPFGTGSIPQVEVVACKSLRRYATTPQSVKICPGKPILAVAGRYLQLWSLETEQITQKLWTGEQQLVALDYTSDGRLLIAGETEGKLRRFEVDSGEKMKTVGRRSWGLFPDRVRDVCCLFGKGRFAVASDTSNIRIFETSSGKVVRTLDWHQTGFFTRLGRKTLCLSCSKTGLLAAGGSDGSLTVYDISDFESKYHKVLGKGDILAVEFSPDGQFLALSDSRGTVFLLSAPTYKVVQEFKHPASPRALSFSHDMRVLATGSSDCQIRLFHLNTGKELTRLSHHTGGVIDLHFCDSESKLVSVGNDRRLYLTQLAW